MDYLECSTGQCAASWPLLQDPHGSVIRANHRDKPKRDKLKQLHSFLLICAQFCKFGRYALCLGNCSVQEVKIFEGNRRFSQKPFLPIQFVLLTVYLDRQIFHHSAIHIRSRGWSAGRFRFEVCGDGAVACVESGFACSGSLATIVHRTDTCRTKNVRGN